MTHVTMGPFISPSLSPLPFSSLFPSSLSYVDIRWPSPMPPGPHLPCANHHPMAPLIFAPPSTRRLVAARVAPPPSHLRLQLTAASRGGCSTYASIKFCTVVATCTDIDDLRAHRHRRCSMKLRCPLLHWGSRL